MTEIKEKAERRTVPAHLTEATPARNGLFHWILASPFWLFVGWLWLDLFVYISPLPWLWLNYLLAILIYTGLLLLPLGYGAHRLVTNFPTLFQNAGWDIAPLEPVHQAEVYLVRYQVRGETRAETNWSRIINRAGQGWVYIEVVAIFVGAILMIPLFFSASEFGFGR